MRVEIRKRGMKSSWEVSKGKEKGRNGEDTLIGNFFAHCRSCACDPGLVTLVLFLLGVAALSTLLH